MCAAVYRVRVMYQMLFEQLISSRILLSYILICANVSGISSERFKLQLRGTTAPRMPSPRWSWPSSKCRGVPILGQKEAVTMFSTDCIGKRLIILCLLIFVEREWCLLNERGARTQQHGRMRLHGSKALLSLD